MPDDYLEASGELVGEIKPPKKKRKNVFVIILEVLLVMVFVASLCLSGSLIYLKSRYTQFFVDGCSMWPTFNADGYDANGKKISFSQGASGVGYSVDYGFADDHQETLLSLKRFDIVVTHYANDYSADGKLKTSVVDGKEVEVAAKIKRLVGLPGEKVFLIPDGTPLGSLYVYSSAEESPVSLVAFQSLTAEEKATHLVTQPYDQAYFDSFLENGQKFPAMTSAAHFWNLTSDPDNPASEINQYVVLGDNRNYSSDSRDNNAVLFPYLVSKVVMVIGRCTIKSANNCAFQYNTLKWPWDWGI